MYVLFEQSPAFTDLDHEAKGLLSKLISGLSPVEAGRRVSAGNFTMLEGEHLGMLYVLREGIVACRYGPKELFTLEPGDLMGLPQFLGGFGLTYRGEFAVVVDAYRLTDFQDLIRRDAALFECWQQYLAHQFSILHIVLASVVHAEGEISPSIKTYQKGDTIIRQGEPAQEVYTLVSGTADVFVDDVKVGEIKADEIFGMLAALTTSSRTATVIARDSCMVLALPRERFVELIAARPSTVLDMIEDMAQLISSLNERVVGFEKSRL